MDIQKQIEYWLKGGEEDLDASCSLMEKKHFRHSLFFAHLALEKVIKAKVTEATHDIPPRIHDLLRLSEMAKISLTKKQREFLARFQKYSIEGRYPDFPPPSPTRQETETAIKEIKEFIQWLRNQLNLQ